MLVEGADTMNSDNEFHISMKKAHKISDCWTTYGKVMTKDLAGKITEVKSPADLLHY